jgi:hypothetical protein
MNENSIEEDKNKYKKLGVRILSLVAILICILAIYDFFTNKLGKLIQLKH